MKWRRNRRPPAPPEPAPGILIGEARSGDLREWVRGGTAFYPADVLGRHLVVVGGTGSGKTETLLRLAYGAAAELGWQVLYLDAKGDPATVPRFMAAMRHAGLRRLRVFPDDPYDGWRGEGLALLNRLMAVEDFTEPYYRSVTKLLLSGAVDHPLGEPRSSDELIERLDRGQSREVQGAVARYRSFFAVLGGKLDGRWAFEDADAAYVLLDGLALKEEAASLGRFLVEDFAHYVAKRKRLGRRVLLVIDEFSALAMDADAANLFERVRSFGAAVIVSSQSFAGLGDGAERILDAAAGVICHQGADPERLAARAGTRRTFALMHPMRRQTRERTDVAQLIGLAVGIWPHFAAFSTLFGLPGGSGARWRLGARRPSQRERQIVDAALSRLGERRARLPRRWYVVDAPTFNASVLGTTLFVHREMIYSPYLEAVLAHECGHIEAGDGHLALALERFAFPGLPAVRSWLLRMDQPVLAAVVLAVAGGWAATLPGVMSAWRWYFRRREHKADRIARKLGYADQFAEYLDTHDLPLDAASPFMIGRTHPYAEQRIERLRST